MQTPFTEILAEGGKTNSLGRSQEVIDSVLNSPELLDELYSCLFDDDAWVRMRAIDAFEKICRVHPDWIERYIDRLLTEFTNAAQPSIQWHLAQIYPQVRLNPVQSQMAVSWLKRVLSTSAIDWIVSANAMDALVYFYQKGCVSKSEVSELLTMQLGHSSKSVVTRANKHLSYCNG